MKVEDEVVSAETTVVEQTERESPEGIGKETSASKREDKGLNPTDIKLSLKTRIKGAIVRNISLSEPEIENFLDTLSISMLQSDVAQETTEKFTKLMSDRLHSTKFDYKNMRSEIIGEVRDSLLSILKGKGDGVDILRYVRDRAADAQPVRILFLGPNGTGKTTTIAKVAYMFKQNGISCVISASDTFRAAAIEQTEHHAAKVGVPVIRGEYGADPASIAFNAIEYAKAHRLNVVLIDTAGRQETNKNLIMEVQKIVRISKPDLVIYIGESTSGNVIPIQISEFNKFVKIDGIILTKLDCDAKGGNAISISDVTGIPILFFGTGESYQSLIKYDPDFIVNSIVQT
ncbi:MAG: signal recognition particle-docking protein FtsY [Candidatus Marsarchaeota archaeon]|nr:signal recognition particle-docking protein FtsY [Candidatus Marsarchaeota archaeon]